MNSLKYSVVTMPIECSISLEIHDLKIINNCFGDTQEKTVEYMFPELQFQSGHVILNTKIPIMVG